MPNNYSSIIWDWNGTLLDDVDICIETINYSLGKRKLPVLTRKKYREIFTFPVVQYYEKAGFDFSKNSFDELSHEFIDLYLNKLKGAQLFPGAEKILRKFSVLGYRQFILSAMEQKTLEASVSNFMIEKYFYKIQGISDIYAHGKLHIASSLLKTYALDPRNTCLIGDTLHDLEVAEQLGCHCMLISGGHQSHTRLNKKHHLVARTIQQVPSLCKID